MPKPKTGEVLMGVKVPSPKKRAVIQLSERLKTWTNMMDEVKFGAEELAVGMLMELPGCKYASKDGVTVGPYPPLIITEVSLLSRRKDPRVKCTGKDGFTVFFEDMSIQEKDDLLHAMMATIKEKVDED